MKLSFKKPQKLTKKHLLALSLGTLFVVAISGLVLFRTQIARSAIADDSKFRFVMPYFGGSSQGAKTYLEVAQVGQGNTLDADGAWSKFYFDSNRVNNGTIGIFKGGYGSDVDSLGTAGGDPGKRFNDPDAVKYEFYLARDTFFTTPKGVTVAEETPCRINGQLSSSLVASSGSMSVDGWYKIAADRFINNAKCGDDRWEITKKTGKYVLFLRVSWATPAPTINGQKQGRLNAYKVGAAYADATQALDNPITGYWSDFTSSQEATTPQRASYSVQDRVSANATNGSYTFQFAPDCRLSKNDTEVRYLHWRDVDYPAYYQAPWPAQPAPDFKLYEISPSGSRTEISIDQSYKKFNGNAQNIHGSAPVTFKGGSKYEWVWTNIARVDGISFWIPYDDYSTYAGCGEWSHQLNMKAGPDGQLDTKEFRVGGGQTAAINLTQNATGKDAGPATDLDLTVASASGQSIAAAFSGVTTTLGGATASNSTATSRVLHWENLSPIGGAYPLTRNNIYAYFKVADNAPDGARYCASAVMSPKSSTESGGTRSTPNQICFVIDNSLKPYVATSGQDVHAGDCTVKNAQGQFVGLNGKILGPPANGGTKGSSGTYIVSAGDAITDFGSGGSASGGMLTFGKGGKYGSICRPDFATLKALFNKDEAVTIAPNDSRYSDGTTFNMSRLPGGGRYKVTFPGNGRITGQSSSNVSFISENGSITLDGATVGSNMGYPAASGKLPVVGIVANSILVNNNVTTINAVMYARGNINTCSITDWINQCKSTLTVNGFAMAGNFTFRRVSGLSNGLQLGEQIDFNAAFYLSAPAGFREAAGQVKYLGERAPLY